MKNTMKKLVSLALLLPLLAVAACASASSATWEMIFLGVAEHVEMPIAGPFTVTENPDYDPPFRFIHTLDIGGFMELNYYDDGNDAFNSAILTIDLDYTSAHPDDLQLVVLAIVTTIMSGDQDSEEHIAELLEVLCPDLGDVLTGELRLNGAQVAEMNGINYMIELNEDTRTMRFFTHVTLDE